MLLKPELETRKNLHELTFSDISHDVSAAVSRQHGLGWFLKSAHRNAGAERNVLRCGEEASGEEQRSGERRKTH